MSNTEVKSVLNTVLNLHPENRNELVSFWNSLNREALEEYVRVAKLYDGF